MSRELNCITELIGVKGSCSNPERVKYFLDNYGISLKVAANTADEKHMRGIDLINSKIDLAYDETLDLLMANGFDLKNVASQVVLGSHGALLEETPLNGSETIIISNRKHCPLVVPKVVELSICGRGEVGILIDDEPIFSGEIDGIKTINYFGFANEIKIAGNEFYPCKSEKGISCQCKCLPGSAGRNHLFWESTNNQMNGLMMTIQASCDKERLTCMYRDKVAKAVIYKAVAMIYVAMYESNRFNDFIAYNQEKALILAAKNDSSENLHAYDDKSVSFTSDVKVRPGKFQQQMKQLNKIIVAPKKGCCTECSGSQYLIAKP